MSNKKIPMVVGGKGSRGLTTLLALLSCGFIHCANAEVYSGDDCGEDCHWSLDTETGVLSITGFGAMSEKFGNQTIAENTQSSGAVTTKATYGNYWNEITSISIGEGITTTGRNAFQGLSNVTSVSLPSSLESIGGVSFDRMPNLSTVTIPNNSKLISMDEGAFQYSSSLSNQSAQSIINTLATNNKANNSSTYLYQNSFYGSGISEITIPAGINLAYQAFYGDKNLTSVTIEDGVTTIGTVSFAQCSNLTSVDIADSVTQIKDKAFKDDDIRSLTIPGSVTSIGKEAFYKNLNLSELILEEGVTDIGSSAFYGGNLSELTIPGSATSIGSSAFNNNNLENLTINEGVSVIGQSAFANNKISSLDIPNSVTEIGSNAFSKNQLTGELIIPDSVTSLKDYAFGYNQITSVVIPDSVTYLGSRVFRDNADLTEVIISDDVDTSNWHKYALGNLPEGVNIRCQGDVDKCKTALQRYLPAPDGTCTNSYCLQSPNFTPVTSQAQCETGKYRWDESTSTCNQISESACNDNSRYYYNGSSCKTRSNNGKIACVNSSYRENDGYCDRIRYTPAEAAKVVRDDNTNEIVITFKK